MELENKEFNDVMFNIISCNWKFINCTVTGVIEGNTGEGTIEFINCKFPNGINVRNNSCRIKIS